MNVEYLTEKEKRLVETILSGDKNAFRQIISDYQKLVSHIVNKMISNSSVHEDLCQEVFIKVYKNLSGFGSNSKLSTWIGKISYNHCLNYIEKKKMPAWSDLGDGTLSIDSVSGDFKTPLELTELSDISERLREQINNLPGKFRLILTMYHLDELKYGEIAKIMKLPEGTVKSYLFRARKLLKENLLTRYNREDLCA